MPEKANVLAVVTGGIGDVVTAEPALRFALGRFRNEMDISVLTYWPWLFSHLKFKEVFAAQEANPDFSKYIVRGTYPLAINKDAELKEPLCSFNMNGVDFSALQLLKWQLPIADREIYLVGDEPKRKHERYADPAIAFRADAVLVHAGTSTVWKSKTFPKSWWEEVVAGISRLGATPVLIGQNAEFNGVWKIEAPGAVDLVGKLNIRELIYVLQRARVLITNDSLPLHIAASREPEARSPGDAWIGFLATAKHPDFLLHYRQSEDLGWNMENLSRGGVWSRPGMITDGQGATDEEIASWLPVPSLVARWAVKKGRER